MEFERIADKKRVDFIVASIRNNVPAGGEILDVGCGNGIITRAVGALGYKTLGIDVSEKTIDTARACNRLPNVTFSIVAADALDPAPSKYDAIICSEVLEHLDEPQELLSVLHRSLKATGVLIVTVPNGRGPRELFVTRPIQRLQRRNGILWRMVSRTKRSMGYTGTTVQSSADDLSHIQFFTVRSLKRLAVLSGFVIESVRSSNFLEQVFPFSLFMRRSIALQRLDCRVADALPVAFTSGFMSVWRKGSQ